MGRKVEGPSYREDRNVCVCVCVKEGEGASGEGVSRGVSFQISQKRSFEFSIVTCNL